MMAGPSSWSSLSSDLSSLSQELFTCAVCYDRFDQNACKPKLLPCHHTFCSRCLCRLTSDQNQLRCPLCDRMCTVQASNIESLPTNHYLVTFIDALKSLQHQIQPVNSLSDDESLCNKHSGTPRFFWCDTCHQAICLYCTGIDHNPNAGHSIGDISDARHKLQHNVLVMSREIKNKFDEINECRNRIQMMRSPNAEKVSKVLTNVMTSFVDSVVNVMPDETLNLRVVIDKVTDFIVSESFENVTLLHKNCDLISGLVTKLDDANWFLRQKEQEAAILMKSKVFITLTKPEIYNSFKCIYCSQCGNSFGIAKKIPRMSFGSVLKTPTTSLESIVKTPSTSFESVTKTPTTSLGSLGKRPYNEQTTENTCEKCGAKVIEV